MLQFTDVTFAYPGRMAVLTRLNLSLGPGSLHHVTGANGAGKTTLLKLAAGVLRPTSGTVRLGRPRTYVGVGIGFHESLTVSEEIAYLASVGRQPESQLSAALQDWDFDQQLLTTEVSALSSGWRQRLALAVASTSQADILLLDEPFANLDKAGSERVCAWIDQTTRAGGVVVVVHHGDIRAVGLESASSMALGHVEALPRA